MNKNYKILILGDTFVGKTSLIREYIGNKFSDSYQPTIEDIYTKPINVNDTILDLKFYDVSLELLNLKGGLTEPSSGPPKLQHWKSEPLLTTSYINICDAYVFIYSIANRKSFSLICESLDLINNCKTQYHKKLIYLIGTKSDLSEKREVTKKEGLELSLEYNAIHFETSVITGNNIEKSYQTIIRNIPSSRKLMTKSKSMFIPTLEKIPEQQTERIKIVDTYSSSHPAIKFGRTRAHSMYF